MSTRRRQFREMEVLAVLLMQGAVIPCKRCRVALKIEDVKAGGVQKEHLHELVLGGEDEPHNCAYSHTECHAVVTNGNGATTAGSSSNRRAKANNPGRTDKFVVNKLPLDRPANLTVGEKCRGCGEWGEDCKCPPRTEHRPSFGGRR